MQTVAYGWFQDLRVPKELRVVWKLAEADFEPINLAMEDTQYQPVAFAWPKGTTAPQGVGSTAKA